MKDKNNSWKVCVQSWTYNQAKYIEDTLNGFTVQKTSFPYVCCIIDDASTDGEKEVIENYIKMHFDINNGSCFKFEETVDYTLLYAKHNTNDHCFFCVLFLKYNHHSIRKETLPYIKQWYDNSNYIALCEGDDFWTDSHKLQKQVDFMETHPTHSMCFHAINYFYPNGTIEEKHRYDVSKERCDINDMILLAGEGYAKICSMVYDRNKYGVGFSEWAKKTSVGDWLIQATLFVKGDVAYIDTVMSTYRVSAEGSWTRSLTSNYKKMRSHFKTVEKNWKEFDIWTSFKFHNSVKLQIAENRRLFRYRQIDYLSKYAVVRLLRRIVHQLRKNK